MQENLAAMSVQGRARFSGQQRVDVPHLRQLESGVIADFDILAGTILGGRKALVVDGFEFAIPGAVGAKASALQLVVASSLLCHYNATEPGSIFQVPADRAVEILSAGNARLTGSFIPGTTNYVGIDLVRAADATTADTVSFLDADTLIDQAQAGIPLRETLDYRIVVSAIDFDATPALAPVAKVVTDAANNVSSITDARNLMFRLASGGSVPDQQYAYPWPEGRLENSTEKFQGGDRALGSLRVWCEAVMTRLWEIAGGERWFSAVSDRNVKMSRSASGVFANGEFFEWDGTNLHWKNLRFIFPNSTGYYNDIADQLTDSTGLTNLADGECIYVDLDFSQNLTGASALVLVKAVVTSLGSPTIPGSRYVVAWRNGSSVYVRDNYFPVGSVQTVATASSVGVVRLTRHALVPASPAVTSTSGGWFQTPNLTHDADGFTAVTQTGSGLGTVNPSGKGTAPVDCIVKITLAGNVGVAKFQLSTNRGYSYNAEETTAASVTDSTTGIILNFDSGPGAFVLDDTYSFGVLFAPLAVFRDRHGVVREARDHSGYDVGSVTEIREHWDVDHKSVTVGKWTFSNSGTGSGTSYVEAEDTTPTAYPGPKILLENGTDNNGAGNLFAQKGWLVLLSRLVIVMEWDAASGATMEDSVEYMGLLNAGGALILPFTPGAMGGAGLWFKRDEDVNSAKWIIGASTAAASTATNTTISAAADWQRFKIEFIGGDFLSGTPKARYFIDGEYAGEITTNLPASTVRLAPIFTTKKTAGAGASHQLRIGGILVKFRRFKNDWI